MVSRSERGFWNWGRCKTKIRGLKGRFGFKVSSKLRFLGLLGGSEANYGDCSVRVNSLPLVPITVVLWAESPEFSASANMLFDASISRYLTTEEVAMLGELTSTRLRHAYEVLGKTENP